jgi:hypothetical protein
MSLTTEEIIGLIPNFNHIDDEHFVAKVRAEIKRHLLLCFDQHGNFSPRIDTYRGGWSYEDCRNEKEHEEMRVKRFLFTEEGDVREEVVRLLPDVIDERQFNWLSDAVCLHYAEKHGRHTHGSYPACWMHK